MPFWTFTIPTEQTLLYAAVANSKSIAVNVCMHKSKQLKLTIQRHGTDLVHRNKIDHDAQAFIEDEIEIKFGLWFSFFPQGFTMESKYLIDTFSVFDLLFVTFLFQLDLV